ncbi:MAG: hypothetical protein IPL33_10865 [Sphingobacteriales bacterium]|nr:hypothetical protein [Sphingobacteriales bacterium]
MVDEQELINNSKNEWKKWSAPLCALSSCGKCPFFCAAQTQIATPTAARGRLSSCVNWASAFQYSSTKRSENVRAKNKPVSMPVGSRRVAYRHHNSNHTPNNIKAS